MTLDRNTDERIKEIERQLRQTRIEIQEISQRLGPLREKYEVEKQKEIEAKARAGEDILDFEPSRELTTLDMSVTRTEQNLENSQQKEADLERQLENLKIEKFESQLIKQSQAILELRKRESEILAELTDIQTRIKAAEEIRTHLAEQIVGRDAV